MGLSQAPGSQGLGPRWPLCRVPRTWLKPFPQQQLRSPSSQRHCCHRTRQRALDMGPTAVPSPCATSEGVGCGAVSSRGRRNPRAWPGCWGAVTVSPEPRVPERSLAVCRGTAPPVAGHCLRVPFSQVWAPRALFFQTSLAAARCLCVSYACNCHMYTNESVHVVYVLITHKYILI